MLPTTKLMFTISTVFSIFFCVFLVLCTDARFAIPFLSVKTPSFSRWEYVGARYLAHKSGNLLKIPDRGMSNRSPSGNLTFHNSSPSLSAAMTRQTDRTKILQIGYFEGFRKHWIYKHMFKRPPSPRDCHCTDRDGRHNIDVVVTLERDANKTGTFDILFMPQDVAILPGRKGDWDTILSTASPNQRRVYATFEGVHKVRHLVKGAPYNGPSFHWSWTYHSRSDFTMPYGSFVRYNRSGESKIDEDKNWAEGKTGLVAWMSTWKLKSSWERAGFVSLLQTHLKIDRFGKGFEPCPRVGDECEMAIRKYKFYLALENSCCSEYITEKFWRTLSWAVIPIVVGANRRDYERLAPPNSFIYADDFDSVQDLANYIIYLSENDIEYNKYFSWKYEGEVHVNYPSNPKNVTSIPPDSFFYSCKSACRVAERYTNERALAQNNEDNLTQISFFNPKVDWWRDSCTPCGQQKWISEFQSRSNKKRN